MEEIEEGIERAYVSFSIKISHDLSIYRKQSRYRYATISQTTAFYRLTRCCTNLGCPVVDHAPSVSLSRDVSSLQVEKSKKGQIRRCHKCKLPKPDRAHHCMDIKRKREREIDAYGENESSH